MVLTTLDWGIVAGFMLLSLIIGTWASKRSSKDSNSFFLSGSHMPWWLLGMSMVATTFSTDTPNLVTDIVRRDGVAGNWAWWAFLLTGMLTTFIYARLWRRSGAMTDLEFYELRYSGKPAAFLRGFRAIYLGVVFNVAIMASVTLAAIKIGSVLFNFSPMKTILIAGTVTVIFSSLGGFLGVLLTDFILFIIAMIGAVATAVIAINHPEVGGLAKLRDHPNLLGKVSIFPDFNQPEMVVTVLIIPLAVQWWSVWYPGAEPGGGGYVAQRMLAARSEGHAIGATFFFNVAHYALRPWPWILVALASLVVFPDLKAISAAFPHIPENVIGHDLAYPAMLTFLPRGLLGLVVASLVAAYMSTISTHLNWGASYVINDCYARFLRPKASERELVLAARLSTIVIMFLACSLALFLESALDTFRILLSIGAGTGLLFIMRWFWWRINAFSEITAMTVSFAIACYFQFVGDFGLPEWQRLLISVGLTTVAWVAVSYIFPSEKRETLISFYKLIRPGGPGWSIIPKKTREDGVSQGYITQGIKAMVAACGAVYCFLFGTGYLIYGNKTLGLGLFAIAAGATFVLFKIWQGTKS